MTHILSGGCQCGRIRYTATLADFDAYLCHCKMCRRATGGVSIAFKNLAKTDVVWETEPDWYESSPIAQRPFCSSCGTPLGFAYPDSENIDLTIGSFDDHTPFVCKFHFAIEERLPHWADTADLPGYRIVDNPRTVDRWMKAQGKLPD